MDIAYLAHGILGDQPKAEQDFNTAAQILHTNFMAPVSLLTWLANFCVQRHAGTLAVISSVAGDRGRKSNYVYGSSKAGLSAFLAGLRNRVDREGVTVLTIKPGPVKTAMTAGMPSSEKFADVDTVAESIVSAIDKRKRHPLRPIPVAAHHVRHPQHPRAHLQETKSINSVAPDQISMNFGFCAGQNCEKSAIFNWPTNCILISQIPLHKRTPAWNFHRQGCPLRVSVNAFEARQHCSNGTSLWPVT